MKPLQKDKIYSLKEYKKQNLIKPQEVRDGEHISSQIKFENSFLEFRVWRISPLGVDVLVDKQLVKKIQKLNVYEMKISLGLENASLKGLVTSMEPRNNNQYLVCLRYLQSKVDELDKEEKRKDKRIRFLDQFQPSAIFSNPCRFNDFIYMKAIDVSANGMQFRTSLRNKYIVPGIKFSVTVNFPSTGEINVSCKVISTRVEKTLNGQYYLFIGTKFERIDNQSRSIIGQYLIQFGENVDLKLLIQEGFKVEEVSKSITYTYAKSEDDMYDVLKLRKKCYVSAGKASEDKELEKFSDKFDSRSRIFLVKHHAKAIGTVRLIFNSNETDSEQEKHLGEWPADFPNKNDVVEITRACTDPNYRGNDLLLDLFKQIALVVTQSKREWAVICATPKMASLYRKMGFKDTGYKYLHPELNNTEHLVLMGNVPRAMAGVNISPFYWNVVWKDVSQHMNNYNSLNISTQDRIRMNLYRKFSPISNIARKLYLRKKK